MMRELVLIGEWAAMIDEYNQMDVEKIFANSKEDENV